MSFINTKQLKEAVDIRIGKVSDDGDAGVDTPWLDMTNVYRMAFIVQTEDSQAVSTVQLRQAKDDAGDEADDLGDSITVDAQAAVLEVPASDLSDGFTHVRANVSTDGEHAVAVIPVAMGSYRGG